MRVANSPMRQPPCAHGLARSGDKKRMHGRWSTQAVNECVREEVKKGSRGAEDLGGVRRGNRKLRWSKAFAAKPDEEM